MTDQDIVRALKNGQTEVMKELYNHFPSIKNHIMTNQGKTEDAEDIFQETLMVFYKNVLKDDFELRSQIKTYLFGISRNLWLKRLRDRKAHFMTTDADDELIANLDFSDQEDYSEDVINQLVGLLDETGEPCKSILISYYFKKLSMKVIAESMSYKSEQVARQQKYRCIQQLKKRADDLKLFED